MDYLIWVFVPMAFIIGCVVGSGLNVAIYRLPREKSMMWPSSRCGTCYQPIRWYDNIPLLSYWILRGRCRVCKSPYSIRYFFVELFTGLAFAGLFVLDVIYNVNDIVPFKMEPGQLIFRDTVLLKAIGYWLGHCILVSYFIVTSMCDLDEMAIPLSVTIPGTLIGLCFSMLFPWPWPCTQADLDRVERENRIEHMKALRFGINAEGKQLISPDKLLIGSQPFPAWYPWPSWAPPGTWRMGLLNSLAGILIGSMVPRSIRFLFGLGRQKEGLGMGDADLMMMAGAFLGWQVVVVAFFVSVFPGLLLGIVQLIRRGDQSLPFGPPLALGTMITVYCWGGLGRTFQPFFFAPDLIIGLVVVGAVFLLMASFILRLIRGKG